MKIYSTNKKAKFDYELLDKFEAGIELYGQEVKSIRSGQVSLKGGYITFHDNEALLTNVHIPPYKYAGNLPNYDPERSRKLLLKRKEIEHLRGKAHEKGLTIVPISLYTRGPHIKVEVAVAKGKKKYDKRRQIKEREIKREIQRTMKQMQP